MNETQHHNLIRYVNDVIAMERDIVNAVRTQLEDERVRDHPELKALFLDIAVHGDHRADMFEKLVEQEGGGTLGGTIKEGIASISGVLGGLFGMARMHPLSGMVRDNIVAMDLASVSYGMLLTVAIATGHKRCEELALSSLNDCPGFVLRLTGLLPRTVLEEIFLDAPVEDTLAARRAEKLIRESWSSANP